MDIIALIENVAGFIWGGTWGDAVVIPGQIGPLAVVLLGTGLFMMVRLAARPLRRFVPALVEVWQGRKAQGEDGAITPWQALSTALSGQVGTGNLAGVATAITLGGPGAIFWMWIVAIFGMALAFSESSLAVKYRETDEYGRINGGPMYYIKNGLGKNWGWLAIIFCIGTLFSAAATGGMIQANSIMESVTETSQSTLGLSIPAWAIGLVLAALVFAVIIGGIKSIGSFAGKVVPVMAALYVLAAFIVLLINADKVPGAFGEIIGNAFGWHEAAGGAAGYGVMQAVRYGIARGLFSNEAGQGSAPIAHAAARTKNPVQQGEIAMIGVFIDTIVICTMTALVILTVVGDFKKSPALMAANSCIAADYALPEGTEKDALFPSAYTEGREQIIVQNGAVASAWLQECRASGVEIEDIAIEAAYPAALQDMSTEEVAALEAEAGQGWSDLQAQIDEAMIAVDHAWETDANSAAITTRAYGAAFPGGEFIVPVALFFFAFTTIIGWSYYGEQAATYMIGEWATHPFRYIWVVIIFLGTIAAADWLWLLGDIANASMAFPNLIAIAALSSVVVAMHKLNDDPDHGHPVLDKTEERPGE
ncbi:alanine/glycine:cation symporter family protein [Henriciella aquimarina]|uniref:alanine/glycine:cation symporter family protein n=1 Tax=Henriciella aquimarina TaxID=545261 RepID=UPI0009FBC916|nr:sodium:alanine symporter family protein [Henriciella aquimarina]